MEEPVKDGLLLFPPQGVLSQLKKTWHKKYCQLFRASNSGIDRLEIWDSREDCCSQQSSPRIITMEACVKIGPSNQPKVIAVVTKTTAHHFGCYTEQETCEWINAFQQVAFKNTQSSNNTIEEDNDLYCTTGEGVFTVRLTETDASKRCGLEPKIYTLLASAVDLKLTDGNITYFTWPYHFIRKYGYRDGRFTFEAGRKCESGEGTFKLEHGKNPEIFRYISGKMKHMKQLLRSEGELSSQVSVISTQSVSQLSSGVDLNDMQYHAALSMEAGSRSPLPPTPNLSAISLMDMDFSSISQKSSAYMSACSSTESTSPFIRPPPPLIKPKPAKPPRKYVFPGLHDKKIIDSELPSTSTGVGKYRKLNNTFLTPELSRRVSSLRSDDMETNNMKNNEITDDEKHRYDLVEVRNNAWRTHGIDNVMHTERATKQQQRANDNRDNSDVVGDERNNRKNNQITSDTTTSVDDACADRSNDFSHNDNEDAQYERMTMDNSNSVSLEITTTSPIIHNNLLTKSDSTANYDKLQHIGSTYKLNNNPGYRTPNVTSNSIATTSSQSLCNTTMNSIDDCGPQSWNDYDIVEDISAVRIAEDNNRGYGVIRKKTSLPPGGPQHTVYNNSEYAIVSKPKRV